MMILPEEMSDYRVIVATIKLRRDDRFQVLPNAECVDGLEVTLRYGWFIEKSDSKIYAGEHAWIIADYTRLPFDSPAWIASGDLINPRLPDLPMGKRSAHC